MSPETRPAAHDRINPDSACTTYLNANASEKSERMLAA